MAPSSSNLKAFSVNRTFEHSLFDQEMKEIGRGSHLVSDHVVLSEAGAVVEAADGRGRADADAHQDK